MVAPTRPGNATNQKSSFGLKVKPMADNNAATMLNNCQTENPKNSAKIEKTRLRRATYLPWLSQNALSSGSHFSIQPVPGLVPAAELVAMHQTPFTQSPTRQGALQKRGRSRLAHAMCDTEEKSLSISINIGGA